jgi:hypothetical protein
MPHGAYCVAFKHNRWTVSQFGRDLGSFYFRAKALKFAVESACWSAGTVSVPSHERLPCENEIGKVLI